MAVELYPNKAKGSSILKAVAAATFFGGLWGGWAYYCNMSFGFSKAVHAGLTQFTFSFIATFFFALIVDYLYDRNATLLGKVVFAFLLPVSVMAGSLVLVHYLRGTPRIFITVMPSTTIAALYCLSKIVKGALSMRLET